MHTICFLAVAMVGVDVGWRPAENGDLEYIIQIDPEQARTLKTGDIIEVGVRPQLRSVRRFRIVVGNNPLPRKLQGESAPPPPIAVVRPQAPSSTHPVTKKNLGESIVVSPEQSTRDRGDDAAHWIAAEENGPSPAASSGTTIPTVPIHPDRLADRPNTGPRYKNLPPPPSEPAPNKTDPRGYRYGDSVPVRPPPEARLNALPPPPEDAPLQISLPPPPQIATPPEMPLALEPGATLPSKASALPVTTIPRNNLGPQAARPVVPATSLSEPKIVPSEETFSGNRSPASTDGTSSTEVETPGATGAEGPSAPPVTASPARSVAAGSSSTSGDRPTPWLPLTFTLFALFASLGGNLYLGWITWELRNRFRETTKEAS